MCVQINRQIDKGERKINNNAKINIKMHSINQSSLPFRPSSSHEMLLYKTHTLLTHSFVCTVGNQEHCETKRLSVFRKGVHHSYVAIVDFD